MSKIPFDSQKWISDFKSAVSNREFGNLHKLRCDIYDGTIDAIMEGKYVSESGSEVVLPIVGDIVADSRFYKEKIQVDVNARYDTVVRVENIDCLNGARMLIAKGLKPVLLNMADRRTPGGGVAGGAGAQEENIFRRTNILLSLYQYSSIHAATMGLPKSEDRYPLDMNYGGIYSKSVTVFRDNEDKGYAFLEHPYIIDVVSVPAISHPDLDADGNLTPLMVEGTKRKIRTILNIAAINGNDSLVLSAFGCGAFRNPPHHMAKLFHEIIDNEFKGFFKEILFAIIEDHNSRGINFSTFAAEFNK